MDLQVLCIGHDHGIILNIKLMSSDQHVPDFIHSNWFFMFF